VVRVVPFHYTGKVWCLRVPTGAFVAVRNGVAFPTGNSGFPKSLDVSKAIDKAAGVAFDAVPASGVGFMNAEGAGGYNVTKNQLVRKGDSTEAARQWQGWGTALKPALEPITMARKPLVGTVAANVLAHGTGALNIDGCRVGAEDGYTENAVTQGINTARTSYAPAGVRRTFAPSSQGRWPANLIHDGGDEVVGLFPVTTSGGGNKSRKGTTEGGNCYGTYGAPPPDVRGADKGSAARFFYCAKASKRDRNEGCEHIDAKPYSHDGRETPIENAYQRNASNSHPTVKPTDLMAYLCRLVTPPGGTVLDPFMGSGSTGKAAIREGFRFIGIEREAEYIAIANARISHELTQLGKQQDLFEGAA
jgi:site-specific DNA-methyltransferase (adenine-specific)